MPRSCANPSVRKAHLGQGDSRPAAYNTASLRYLGAFSSGRPRRRTQSAVTAAAAAIDSRNQVNRASGDSQ